MWRVSYWVLPVISGVAWLAMLLAMLIVWAGVWNGGQLAAMDQGQDVAYISDVGASELKPLFIAGSCVTTVFLDLAFLSERWLRHTGRLSKMMSLSERISSAFSILFAVVGTAGLILLSIFDTLRHPTLHDIFLVLFMGGYIISAVFLCVEYQRLGIHYRQHPILRLSFWIKLTFIIVELALAIAFGVLMFSGHWNTSAVIEWVIAFVFTFYVFSFFVDLMPAVYTKQMAPEDAEMELEQHANLGGRF